MWSAVKPLLSHHSLGHTAELSPWLPAEHSVLLEIQYQLGEKGDFSQRAKNGTVLSTIQRLVTSDDCFVKLNHQSGSFVPVHCDFSWKSTVGQNGLNDAAREGCTVQRAVLFRHGDVRVNQRLFLNDVVGLVIIVGLLQFVCFLPKQGLPYIYLNGENSERGWQRNGERDR